MATYSVRCRNSTCRHRRVSRTHPDAYKQRYRCPACREFAGWRIENRDYNRRNLCNCGQVAAVKGNTFPHRRHNPYCEQNPWADFNLARLQGVPGGYLIGWNGPRPTIRQLDKEEWRRPDWPPEIPQGRAMGPDEPCPF